MAADKPLVGFLITMLRTTQARVEGGVTAKAASGKARKSDPGGPSQRASLNPMPHPFCGWQNFLLSTPISNH